MKGSQQSLYKLSQHLRDSDYGVQIFLSIYPLALRANIPAMGTDPNGLGIPIQEWIADITQAMSVPVKWRLSRNQSLSSTSCRARHSAGFR